MSFVLALTSLVVLDVKALVPTGTHNGWREITFQAHLQSLPQSELRGMSAGEAMEKSVVSVDFGNLSLDAKNANGEPISPRDIALGNTYTYNALLATFRDEVLAKNLEAKNSKTSRGH